ncbi:MAG: Hpt domain-containing protein [Bacteroidota bacterium]
MIDLSKLEKLLNGNEKMVNRFIDIFKTQTPAQLDVLVNAVASNDWSQASITAHAIKSQCRYLGLDEIAEDAFKIEQLAERQEQLNLLPGLTAMLQTKVRAVLNQKLL